MPISYTFSLDSCIVYSKAEGVLTLEDLLHYLESVVGDARITEGFVELVDIERVTDFRVSYSDTSPFAPIWKRYLEKGCRGTVVYAPGDQAFGVTRMVRGTLGHQLDGSEIEFVVTRSLDEAMAAVDRLKGTDRQ